MCVLFVLQEQINNNLCNYFFRVWEGINLIKSGTISLSHVQCWTLNSQHNDCYILGKQYS